MTILWTSDKKGKTIRTLFFFISIYLIIVHFVLCLNYTIVTLRFKDNINCCHVKSFRKSLICDTSHLIVLLTKKENIRAKAGMFFNVKVF